MGIERVGNWEGITRLIANLAKELKIARETALKRFGLKAEAIATKHISTQDLHWRPLNPAYLASKIRKGLSENILVATSDYYQAITTWVDKSEGTVYTGVKKDAKNSDGGDMVSIAAVHEFGSLSGRIPARPLWQPTFAETVNWFWKSDSTPEKIFLRNIRKYL